jgi:hypothetical protein
VTHPAKTGVRSYDNCVIGAENHNSRDQRLLVQLVASAPGRLIGQSLRNTLDIHRRAALAGAFGDCGRKHFNLAVDRITEKEDLVIKCRPTLAGLARVGTLRDCKPTRDRLQFGFERRSSLRTILENT